MVEAAELRKAWELWDQQPSNPDRVARYEAAVQAVAAVKGWRVAALRDTLSYARRVEGLTYDEAIKALIR